MMRQKRDMSVWNREETGEPSAVADPRIWAGMIVEAVLKGQDATVLFRLAATAGVDFGELQQQLDAVSEFVRSRVAGPSDRLPIARVR